MMRMWQGASGLAEEDALVSPAYVVLTPKEDVDPRFAAYLFKLPEMVHRFWSYSYGLTDDRLRLYFNDFKRIPWKFPTIAEQQKIADILSTWDEAIKLTEKLLANAEARKRGLMQQLLTGKRRLMGFEGQEWTNVPLGQLASFGKGNGLPKSEVSTSGDVLCIHYGSLFREQPEVIQNLSTYTSGSPGAQLSKAGEVLMPTSDVTPSGLAVASCIMIDGVVIGGDTLIIRPRKDKLDGRFLAHLIRFSKSQIIRLVSGTTVFHIYSADMRHFKFMCPPLKEQSAIANILEDACTEIRLLKVDVQKLSSEKCALMQQFLTGKRRITP